MICVHLNAVLLITPGESVSPAQGRSGEPTIHVEVDTIGDALRQVRFHQPNVLVIDLSAQQTGGAGFERMMGVITEVRSRVPGTPIAVLGAAGDPAMEPAVRKRGATVYLPVTCEGRDCDIGGVIQALYARPGPSRAHGPPPSGVPPR